MSNLSTKRLRFVEEFLIDLNGTQAAIRAGYAAGSAKVAASRLLSNDNVAAEIGALRAKLSQRLEITAEKVLSELARIGLANPADFYRQDGRGNIVVDVEALMDREKAAAVAQMDVQTGPDGSQTIKLKLADKKGALVELGKHLGLFNEKTEVAVTLRNAIESDPRRLAIAMLATLRKAHEAERNSPLIQAE